MKELRVDLPLHILTALYLIGAGAFAITVDAVERLVPTMYLWLWIRSAALCLLIYLLAVEVPISVHFRSRRPLTDAVVRLRGRIGSRALPGLALLINLGVFYGVFTSVKNMLPLVAPHWQDREIADLSQSLHLGHAPWKLLHVLLGYPVVTRIIEFLYVPVWLFLLIGLPVLLGTRRDLAYLRVRYILTMLLCFILLGNVVAAMGMSGGPAFYAQVTGDETRYGELIDYLEFSSGLPFSAWDIQQYLWSCFQSGSPQLGAGISAFPSLHVAMATLFVLAGRKLGRGIGLVLVAYWVAIVIGSVHLGWHYAIDGYASLFGTIALWCFSGWILHQGSGRHAQRRAAEVSEVGRPTVRCEG